MDIKIFKPVAMFEMGSRDNQEDCIYPKIGSATEDDRLFLVCDGMGGHEHGEVASNVVCKEMSECILGNAAAQDSFSDELIMQALEKAYEGLSPYDTGSAKKMGTTMTLAYLHSGGCTVAHLGDSRIYHIRPQNREVLYRSRDHSLVFDLYRAEEITYDEMRTFPRKNIITKAIQPGGNTSLKPDIVHIGNLKPGDYIFLCSDGVLEEMEDEDLVDILAGNGSDEEKIGKIIEATDKNADNHSAYLIQIEWVSVNDSETVVDDEAVSPCNAVNIIKRLGGPKVKKGRKASSRKLDKQSAGKQNLMLWAVLAAAVIGLALAVVWLFGKS